MLDFFQAWDDARERYGSRANARAEASGACLKDLKANDVRLVISQVGKGDEVDALKAVKALAENGLDIVNAILALDL